MPVESVGAVLLLEVRPDLKTRDVPPGSLERDLSELTLLLENPSPGRSWSPTAGQGLSGRVIFEDPADAFPFLHRLRTELHVEPTRAPIRLLAGLGRGDEMTGSRLAGDAFRRIGRKGILNTEAFTSDAHANVTLHALCRTLDALQSSWTEAQWEAICRRDRGQTLEAIGQELGIAYQNVSKRLIAAKFSLYQDVLAAAGLVFSAASVIAR